MANVNTRKVVKAFRFRHDDNTVRDFAVGDIVPAELADHFFVAPHCEGAKPGRLIPGTPQYAAEMRRRVQAQMELESASEAAGQEGDDDGEGSDDGEGEGAPVEGEPDAEPARKLARMRLRDKKD